MRTGLAACAAALLLQACVFLPVTHSRYDHQCRTVAREMTLEAVQFGYIAGCNQHSCGVLLAAAGITAAASAVVSGSVMIIGNVVYWIERQGQCQPAPAVTAPAPAAPSPVPATSPQPAWFPTLPG
jgi:hypothetical protein